jgi:hypothetical protein
MRRLNRKQREVLIEKLPDVARGGKEMTVANFIATFGMVIFIGVIVLLDRLSRRRDRQSHHHRGQ